MGLTGTSERDADQVRDELLATIGELERRRERVTRVRAWVRSPEVSAGAVVGALVAGAAAAGAAWWRLEARRARTGRMLSARAARASTARLPPWLRALARQALVAGARVWLQRWTTAQERAAREAG